MTTIISMNVNGLRACIKHGLVDTIKALDADIVCLQEIRAQETRISHILELRRSERLLRYGFALSC